MKKRHVSIIALGMITSVILAGCGSSSASDESFMPNAKSAAPVAMAESADYEEAYTDDVYEYSDYAAEEASTAAGSSAGTVTDAELQSETGRKLIKTVNLSCETREFDTLIANVTERIESLGGYAQSVDISGNSYDTYSERNAFIVARIPEAKLDHFVKGIEDQSNITSKNESADDVTLEYTDVEAHKNSLKIEQQRLNELLEKADNLESIIALEQRLAEVRYEIESYESRLRTLDNLVVYSTVNLSVQEVKEYTPEPVEELTLGQRIARGFVDSCETAWETIQDFLVGFVSILPMLLVLLLILFVIFLIVFGIVKAIIAIVKSSARKRAERKAKEPPVAVALPNPPEHVNVVIEDGDENK